MSTTYYATYCEDCIADVDSSGDLIRSYTYGPGIDNPLAMTVYGAETNTYYYLTDHLGSVLALTDEDGQPVESYEYDAFGRIKAFDSDFEEIPESAYGNRLTFQGREYSWKTGLYYFRARWYEPVTGRWLSKDPIGISGGLNQYVAFGGNGILFTDPDGLAAKEAYDYWTGLAGRGYSRGGISGGAQALLGNTMGMFINMWHATEIQDHAEKTGHYSAIDGCEAQAWMHGGAVVGYAALDFVQFAALGRMSRALRAGQGPGWHSDPPHKGMGPHDHYGPRVSPNSPHRKYHFGPKNPKGSGGRWPGWREWWKRGHPWRRK